MLRNSNTFSVETLACFNTTTFQFHHVLDTVIFLCNMLLTSVLQHVKYICNAGHNNMKTNTWSHQWPLEWWQSSAHSMGFRASITWPPEWWQASTHCQGLYNMAAWMTASLNSLPGPQGVYNMAAWMMASLNSLPGPHAVYNTAAWMMANLNSLPGPLKHGRLNDGKPRLVARASGPL